jgi:hypothetical protein
VVWPSPDPPAPAGPAVIAVMMIVPAASTMSLMLHLAFTITG